MKKIILSLTLIAFIGAATVNTVMAADGVKTEKGDDKKKKKKKKKSCCADKEEGEKKACCKKGGEKKECTKKEAVAPAE